MTGCCKKPKRKKTKNKTLLLCCVYFMYPQGILGYVTSIFVRWFCLLVLPPPFMFTKVFIRFSSMLMMLKSVSNLSNGDVFLSFNRRKDLGDFCLSSVNRITLIGIHHGSISPPKIFGKARQFLTAVSNNRINFIFDLTL